MPWTQLGRILYDLQEIKVMKHCCLQIEKYSEKKLAACLGPMRGGLGQQVEAAAVASAARRATGLRPP